MAFDPERNGWPLDEAIMRLSDPEALAAHARVCAALAAADGRRRLPPWWRDEAAPALAGAEPPASDLDRIARQQRLAIERALVERLTSGELVGWGRHDSPIADPKLIPASAWLTLGAHTASWRWPESFIHVEEVRRRWVDRQDTWPGKPRGTAAAIIGNRHPLQPRQRLESVRKTIARVFAVRIQPLAELGQAGKSASEKQCAEWLMDMARRRPEAPVTKKELEPQACSRFGVGKEGFKRAWKKMTAEYPAWGEPGRRRKSSG